MFKQCKRYLYTKRLRIADLNHIVHENEKRIYSIFDTPYSYLYINVLTVASRAHNV